MDKKILILIAERNWAFSCGLSELLICRLSQLGWEVTITTRLYNKINASLIFAAGELPYGQLRFLTKATSDRKKPLIFFIYDYDREPWSVLAHTETICRRQNIEAIMARVITTLENNKTSLNKTRPVKLTPRESEVIQYLREGLRTIDIARRLCINMKTVNTHKRNLMKKMGLSKTIELSQCLFAEGMNTASSICLERTDEQVAGGVASTESASSRAVISHQKKL